MKTQVLVAALAGLGAAASANAAVVATGVDTTTGANWRTGAALEADNEYGTDGYMLYGINVADGTFLDPFDDSTSNTTDSQVVLPTGVDIAVNIVGDPYGMWSGNGNFAQMEDPANGNALTSVGLIAGVGAAATTHEYVISRGAGTSFQLTVLVASGDGFGATYETTVDDGSGAVSVTPVAHAADGLHYHVYDISAGSSDVVVSVAGNLDGSFGVTGFAFDNGTYVPEPGSLALLGLGGLMIARRRRG